MNEHTPQQQEQSPSPESENRSLPSPRIYVASLADYVNGRLHGRWIDAADDLDTVMTQIDAMLATSPEPAPEEYAIHDYDGFAGIRISEYDQIGDVVALAQLLHKHGEGYGSYVETVGRDEATEADFESRYQGNYPSVDEFVDHLIAEFGWDTELESLQQTSGIGRYLTIDSRSLATDIQIEWDVVRRSDGTVDIFAPQ